MTSSVIHDVLAAVTRRREPSAWGDARELVARERAAVETIVAGGARAYGFTTRLGQFDAVTSEPGADDSFLDDHLVGWTFPIPESLVRLMSATKATQLAHGGAGVSVEVFDAVRAHAAASDDGAVDGAWLDSYGAADVVPGSWWLDRVLLRTGARLGAGDFIAAVSGDFVSTAVAVAALVESRGILAHYFAALDATDPALWQDRFDERDAAVRALIDGAPLAGTVQAPISRRDATPIVRSMLAADARFEQAIAARLTRMSGNPRLVLDGTDQRLTSQNSYLDFELTTAAHGLAQSLFLAIQHMQRLAEHAFHDDAAPRLVQFPKLAQAVVERSRVLLGAPSFASAQSDGIEDLYDMSLDAALRVTVLSRFARQSLALLARVAPARRDAAALESALWNGLVDSLPDPATRTSWSDALALGWAGGGTAAPARW